MKVRKHGTASMYAFGCRCPYCSKANGASAWAKRKARGWDAPLDMEMFGAGSDPVAVDIGGSHVMVSPEAVRRALAKFANAIKVEALTETKLGSSWNR